MKKIMKVALPLLLVILLITGAIWYMFEYDRSTVQAFLVNRARASAEKGDFETASRLYNMSYELSGEDQNVAIELAEIYKGVGNYTKAESTLTSAIADGGTAELYIALSKTYVEQDKLLDAVNMLDNISDPEIKAQLDAQRPAAPTADYESGFYSQYITVTLKHNGGTLYATTDGEYPSTVNEPYAEPITLPGGETKIYAISVADNGLVSPVSILSYTIGGVIEEVTMADPAIEALVREQLLFGADTVVYSSDLWTITGLTVPAEAATLEDLSHMIYMEELTINDRSLDDLSFLSGMVHLKELDLSGCTITDSLTILASLPNLETLVLSDCSLSTIADLANIQGLKSIDLSDNAIGDISHLGTMTALESIDLSDNAVTNVSALANLPQLRKLNLAHNAMTSMASLASCTNLSELDVSYNTLTDISAVGTLTQLTKFSAAHNNLTDVSRLSGCTELRELDVSNNALTDLGALTGLVKLEELNFAYNAVVTMPALPKDCALLIVNGEHNALTDISALGGMLNLNYVYMDYNQFSEIDFLADCPQLIQVNVYATEVTNASANRLLEHSIIVNFDPT